MNIEPEEQAYRDAIAPPSELSAVPPTTEPISANEPRRLHNVFIGDNGLRAGWSLLIFILILAAILFCGNFVAHKLLPPVPKADKNALNMTATFTILSEGLAFLAVLLASSIMSRIERRPVSVYGLGDRHKLPHFLAGLVWGITCLSLLVVALWKLGLLSIDGRLLFGSVAFRYGALWLFGFLLVALLEEYLTRGYLQYTLTRGLAGLYRSVFKTRHSVALGFWTSAVIFSLLFGLGHKGNPGESPIGLLSAGLAAMVFCLSLWRTGSLWWAIGFHASWDWGQSFVYGVADSGTMIQQRLLATHPIGKPILSGGTTGPEGSIFILAILAVISFIILFTLPRSDHSYLAGIDQADQVAVPASAD